MDVGDRGRRQGTTVAAAILGQLTVELGDHCRA
jgi:hypothetical protein